MNCYNILYLIVYRTYNTISINKLTFIFVKKVKMKKPYSTNSLV